jgi:hypothetical protein
MKKAILVLTVLTASTTAVAKDIAMPEDYLCFAVYNHIQYIGEKRGDRNLARSGHNSKARLTQKYMMTVGGIVDGKSALNQYTGPGKSNEAWSNLIDRCDRKIR